MFLWGLHTTFLCKSCLNLILCSNVGSAGSAPHKGGFGMVHQCSGRRPICQSARDQIPINNFPAAHPHIETCSTKCPDCHFQVLLSYWAFLRPLSSLWRSAGLQGIQRKYSQRKLYSYQLNHKDLWKYSCVQRISALDLSHLSNAEHRSYL